MITAIVLITSLTVLAYFAGCRLGRSVSRNRSYLFAEALAFSLIFAWCFTGSLGWARTIPVSGVVYWSNLMPIFLGFSTGLARGVPGLDRWHRPMTVGTLGLIAVAHLLMPIARPLISPTHVVTSQWKDGVCLQSEESTCGAAAAATLLSLKGIPSTEQEMIRFCLTSRQGTEPLGVYRGLKIASSRLGRDARVASADPDEWLTKKQLPNVALIRFDQSKSGSVRWLLGPRGEGHAIVVLGFEDGHWLLADPAVGRIRWNDSDFRRRFTGDAIYLTKK